ncbi:MAG: hypothetical protein ACPG46_10540 [Thalassotalea sp.]
MKSILLAFIAVVVVSACSSKPPKTEVKKEWRVSKEGKWEEEDVYNTVIYSTEDKEKPKLNLPKKKK